MESMTPPVPIFERRDIDDCLIEKYLARGLQYALAAKTRGVHPTEFHAFFEIPI
jgi:hypothetical protein